MRFLSARSVADGRKAMIFVAIVLLPIAAVSVGGAGWVGRVLVSKGDLPLSDESARDIFIIVSQALTQPGVYGLVIAAVIAALMSTLDTLITAVAAIAVNDIVRPMRPGREDAFYLRIAKRIAVLVTIIGLMLIPVFNQFELISQALTHFITIVIPPLVVVIFMGILSRRFNASAAFWTLLLGAAAILFSLFEPRVILPFAHGVSPDGGFSYMRGLYGLSVSAIIAVTTMFIFRKPPTEKQLKGLVAHYLNDALLAFKGGEPSFEGTGIKEFLQIEVNEELEEGAVRLPEATIQRLHIKAGDMLYICDPRWWWGGLRSVHGKAVVGQSSEGIMEVSRSSYDQGGFSHPRAFVEKML